MPKPLEHIYTERLSGFEAELKTKKQQLLYSSLLRLFVFLLIMLGIYLFWGQAERIITSTLIGIILFFWLVSRHVSLRHKRDKLRVLIDINSTEIEVLNRNFSKLPNGENYKNSAHYFSQDIDLFGKNSFFQYLNRTALKKGSDYLADLFTANDTTAITTQQKAINELAQKLEFRQEFYADAKLSNREQSPDKKSIDQNLETLKSHTFFIPRYATLIATIFSLLSAGFITAYITDFIAGMTLALWFLFGLAITGVYMKRVNKLSQNVSAMQAVFRQYHQLLQRIERSTFSSELLQTQQAKISTETKKASAILKQFSKAIDSLDQRHNFLFGFIANGFLLWDLRYAATLEDWMKAYTPNVEHWFEVIAFFDAYNSLGNFAYNHPHYTFPKITANNTIIKARQAVHPLISPKEAITNDYDIKHDEFLIITGANMAGKSTFLRTVALQIVMSNVGLPVCATTCEYSPIKLITSMRTVDSLAEEASYFYAELSRLKFIIDQLKTDRYFIILDEILKGTNSTDKAIGSQKFLEKLVRSHSTGIIATHDLSLCKVAEHLPQVKNHYFDAQIIADELVFDYKFKNGICQNMNASFLLKKMAIVDD